MKLEKKEIDELFKLHKSLMFFVNKKKNLIKGISSISEFKGASTEKVVRLRNAVVKDPTLIDSFIQENPFKFTNEELKTIESWKEGISDTFYIVKYEKETTFFYHPDTQKCYGVLSLYDPLEDLLGPYLPRTVETWLIPYKGRIIYDGLIVPYNIVFGKSFQKNLQAEYGETIVKHGVLTSFSPQERHSSSDEELLKFYLKSEINWDRYWEEIETLRSKNSRLDAFFHQEQGKHFSRKIKRKLKEIRATGHFAVVDNVVIASAPTKKELDTRVAEILPKEKKEWIHQFRI